MTEPDTPAASPDQLFEEAARWFARMRGPDAETDRPAFDAWLARGALHRSSYNRAAEIFSLGKVLMQDDVPSPAMPAARLRARTNLVVILCVLLAVCGLGLWLARAPLMTRSERQVADASGATTRIEAASKMDRTVRLSEGSRLRLAAGSMVEARLNGQERRISLITGTVRFEVVRDARPFVVAAGGGTVIARGTVFDVTLSKASRVIVRLISGAVEVALPRTSRDRAHVSRQLSPGDTVSFSAQADFRDGVGNRPSIGAGIEGPRAMRDFDNVPLAQLISEANRQSDRPVRLATPALARRRICGRFRIDDPARLAAHLPALFDLAIDNGDPSEIVLRSE
jgi:transmembrane sensor